MLGISSICNLLAAIKTARYFELDGNDVLLLSLTDSVDLYQSRLHELEAERGPYTELQAEIDFERWLLATSTSEFRELRYPERKAIHNLKYFTWVEQQRKTVEELDALWSPGFWHDLTELIPEWDDAIVRFNRDAGVLDRIRRKAAVAA